MASAYEQSNSITEVALKRFRSDLSHNFLNCGTTINERQKVAQTLLNYLCEKFKIASCIVEVKNKPQLHSTRNGKLRSKTYGRYYPHKNYIEIFNLTAMTRKPVAIKTMYDTLLHEFMHHYDFTKLKLSESPHTKGFYARISDLKEKLV